jgi:hypothetical protein
LKTVMISNGKRITCMWVFIGTRVPAKRRQIVLHLRIKNNKKMKKYTVLLFATALTTLFLFNACKKDRVPIDDYQNMDSFYDAYKEAEQEYVIDTPGACPLTLLHGTRICVSADMFQLSDGTPITYPFTLKAVELYSIKDMLLWRLPSVSGGNVLETSAAIRIRTFKNGNELVLIPGRAYGMETANLSSVNNSMSVYFSSGGDWSLATDALSSVTDTASFYRLIVGNMGFVCVARVHSSSSTTTVTLSVPGTNTQNIQSYMSFTGFKGLARIVNLSSTPVPIGDQVKFVAFGKKQTNNYVLDERSFSITGNQQIPLNMQVTTESNLLNALSAL